MNTIQLETAIQNEPSLVKKFQGVFPIDKIPSKRTKGFYIVNLDKSNEPGSHWICIRIRTKEKKNEFFDSYGYAPQSYLIKKFLGKKYIFNSKKLQHLYSTTCGQWCLYYIYFSNQNVSLKEICQPFSSTNSYANDFFVNKMVCQLYRIKTKMVDENFLQKQIVRTLLENIQCCKYYCKLTSPRCILKRKKKNK
jgi:hypothetical protein